LASATTRQDRSLEGALDGTAPEGISDAAGGLGAAAEGSAVLMKGVDLALKLSR
jgi:hypothetical protein